MKEGGLGDGVGNAPNLGPVGGGTIYLVPGKAPGVN